MILNRSASRLLWQSVGLYGGLTGAAFFIAEVVWFALIVVGILAIRWIFHHPDYDILILIPVVIFGISATAFIFPLLKRWWG